eukprot:TRINITY_DN7219_c0_g1_i1.p1 TRINITY_DN7219_c0_g1~~TRINITY_DN7219_c0_g1_i1.p1  ORF type:complete len:134 (+),score=25.38 TRINITY_DN7219_c0_g1_i1:243-644(+)
MDTWIDKSRDQLACQMFSGNIAQKHNFNSHITSVFESLEETYACLGDQWRQYAYRKACGIVRKFPRRIVNQADFQDLQKKRGLGKKLAMKVKEIVQTGSLRKLNQLQQDGQVKTLKLFGKIWGCWSANSFKIV